jgi:hypothetical protein
MIFRSLQATETKEMPLGGNSCLPPFFRRKASQPDPVYTAHHAAAEGLYTGVHTASARISQSVDFKSTIAMVPELHISGRPYWGQKN